MRTCHPLRHRLIFGRAGKEPAAHARIGILNDPGTKMMRSRLLRGLLAASPMLAYLAWLTLARPVGDTLVFAMLGVAAAATFALHRFLPPPKD